jgi:hydroxypyruvate isomerase
MLAADLARDRQVQILIEPINPQDMPGYFLQDFDSAERVVNMAAPGILGLQFDVYHCYKIHGSVIDRLIALLPMTAHIQLAGVPTRSEPAEPQLPLSELFALLENKRYPGRVGCEYHPAEGTLEGLAWITRLEESLK